ncbi:MAG: hypothetical protein JNL26_02620, partial [Gemmatimonadetes bacterium]|nr:hypothetical protein [Gemmatimonadota bacterium]
MRRLALVLAVGLTACQRSAPPADPQLVAQWLRSSLSFVRSERLGPPVASRISAYASLALFEGYAADPASGLRSLGSQLNGWTAPAAPTVPVDGAVIAAVASRIVMDSLFRDGFAATRRTVDSLSAAQVEARVAAGVSEAVRTASESHGQQLAAALLGWAATDGFFETRKRTWDAPTARETWQNTSTPDQLVPIQLSGET